MTARGYFRGHPLVWDKDKWVYEDTGAKIPTYGGEIRACAKCGVLFSLEEVDPCLGILPGVDKACCGHGICTEAYVRFENGVVFRGFCRRRGIIK
jgi:hypothetical protein